MTMFQRIRSWLQRIRSWLTSWVGDAPADDLGSLDVANGMGRAPYDDTDVDTGPFGECPPLSPAQAASISAGTAAQDERLLRDLGYEAVIDPDTGRVRFANVAPVDEPCGYVPTQRGPFADWDETRPPAEHLGITPDDEGLTLTAADLAWLASQGRAS